MTEIYETGDIDELVTRLVEMRRETGMSQRGFAKHANIPLATVRRFEISESNPRISLAQQYAASLGVFLRFTLDGPY